MMEPNESFLLDYCHKYLEQEWEHTRVIRNIKGEEYAVRVACSPLYSETGLPFGFVYALSDLSEMMAISRKIAFVAAHDALTGLPNRILFQDRLQQTISSASREGTKFAVLFIDLDGFKKINDGMGHTCGDHLLKDVARRLLNIVRQSDTVARWGGDEFVLLIDRLTHVSDAADVATKIKASLSHPFLLNEGGVFVTPSIGISLYPGDGDKGEWLLAKADAAMYSTKKNGRNNFRFYSEDLDPSKRNSVMPWKPMNSNCFINLRSSWLAIG